MDRSRKYPVDVFGASAHTTNENSLARHAWEIGRHDQQEVGSAERAMEGGRSADQQEVGSAARAKDGIACGPGNEGDYEKLVVPFPRSD
ncbi:MAG: hypothetical protein QMC95_16895 [Desulfitobacteriaceae bacterium]|nr:hypothetical protein [Desulfitobacteriaceae bacterium]